MSDDAARTITVAGCPVRLYPPPNTTHEFPWVHFRDMLLAAEFLPISVEAWAELWRSSYPDRTSFTANGDMIVPTESATGLFEAARQQGWGPAEQALGQLRDGIHQLFVEAHRDLDDGAFRDAVNEATLRASVLEAVH